MESAHMPGGDRVFIEGLELDVLIGAYPQERLATQRLRVDLEFDLHSRDAAATDRLDLTVDYAAVVARLREWIGQTEFILLEALAEAMAALLLAEFAVTQLVLTLHKPAAAQALGCHDVGVRIKRGQAL